MPEPVRSRILYITHACPTPAKLGPARRHYHILDQLSSRYDVSVLSLATPYQAELFKQAWRERIRNFWFAQPRHGRLFKYGWKCWRTLSARCDFHPALETDFRRLCLQLANPDRFDAIFLSCVLLRQLPLPASIPIVGDTHNVEFDVLRRTAKLADGYLRRLYAVAQSRFTRIEESRCGREVHLLLATSTCDQSLFRQELGIRHVRVVPNGIDLTEFYPTTAIGRRNCILFTGLMSYYPNQQGIRWFLQRVFPQVLRVIPDARLVVAGASPPRWLLRLGSRRIEVTGELADMRQYFNRTSCVIAPLHIGGGTRVKILEAHAMARPVVSTTLGAMGLEECDQQTILLADDSRSFAQEVIRILQDPLLAASIGINGRRHAVEHFDWNQIGKHLSDILQSVIGLKQREEARDYIGRGVGHNQEESSPRDESTHGLPLLPPQRSV